jgi:selenocysteine-specific elongation factor
MPKITNKLPSHSPPTLNVTIGVAGHIDHGKTELVKMLTGCDTDRLKEEKERGMSIEVGYAPCFIESSRVGIVDVPGHERFVRKMVAGATGIDIALLVVAADDGIMPQTREHLDIIQLLGVKQVLIAITKSDLADQSRIDEVRVQIIHFLADTEYPDSIIIPVSSMTGDGIDVLRTQLTKEIQSVQRKRVHGVFRLPIDRIFSSQGHGTIITGIATSGTVQSGDTVEILPLKKTSRIRGMQVYLHDSDQGTAGQCIALNLSNIAADEIERGFVVATPNRFHSHTVFTIQLQASQFLDTLLKNSSRIHFHTGTSETPGQVRLLETDALQAGDSTFAQIQLDRPVCAFIRDRYIIRLETPIRTIGGGTILECNPRRYKRFHDFTFEKLTKRWKAFESNEEFIKTLLEEAPLSPETQETIAQKTGLQIDEVKSALYKLVKNEEIILLDESKIVSQSGIQRANEIVYEFLSQLHTQSPNRFSFTKNDIQHELPEGSELIDSALQALIDEKKIERQGDGFRSCEAPTIDPKLLELSQKIESLLLEERFKTSSPKEIAERFRTQLKSVDEALNFLLESSQLVRITETIYLHHKHVEWAKIQLVEAIKKTGSYETHLFKTLIDSSRKYAIPLLDHFDATGLTRRVGGVRELVKKE